MIGEFAGVRFDGIHNDDVGVTLSGDVQIGNPSKIKNKIRLTGTNIDYDFSEVNGVQQWTPRTLKVPMNILDFDIKDYRSTHLVATRVFTWLARPNERVKLVIDKFPDYFFMAEVVNLDDLETDIFETGHFIVEFEAYPFKIRDRIHLDDEFRTFNFFTDVRQKPQITLSAITEQLPFKLLNVGDLVNIGGWAQYFGAQGVVSRYNTSQSYMIEDIREVEDVDFGAYRYDKTQYYLSGLNTWVRSQDIVQARTAYELEVYNASITNVIPEVNKTLTVLGIGGITIEKDGRFYNLTHFEANRHFTLSPGLNKLKIYGQNTRIKVIWRDEVI
uniref:hypothetical protein n=1 Tax=Jeotgalibaca porci TaxID=1868793 RepID=UPI00359F7F71